MTPALILLADTTEGRLALTDGTPLTVAHLVTGAWQALPGLAVDGDTDELLAVDDSLAARSVRVAVPADAAPPSAGRLRWDTTGRAELHRAAPDSDGVVSLSDRTLLAAGRLDEVATDGLSWSASIVDDPLDDAGLLLEQGATVRPETWPRTDAQRIADGEGAFVGTGAADPAVEAAPYPLILGRPGQGIPYRVTGAGLIETDAPCSPALTVERSAAPSVGDCRQVVAVGRITATTVRRFSVDQNDAPTAEDCAVEVAHDAEGRLVSVISPGSVLDIPPEGAETWIALVTGGGIVDPYGTGELRRADHVIRLALDRSTLRIDRRQLPRLSSLAAYQIDTAVYSQVGAWDWLRGQVLPHLPVAVAVGPAGLYLWPRLRAPAPEHAAQHLTVGVDCAREGAAVGQALDPITRLTVSYALDARAGQCRRRLTVSGRRLPYDGPDVLPSYWAERAWQAHGQRSAEIEVPITSDPATALQIALDVIDRACRPAVDVVLSLDADDCRVLPGDVVTITDADLGLSGQPAQIQRLGYAGGAAVVTARWYAAAGSAATT